ncbi:MAG: phosphomethylpyrimidine synthase ThiC [Candidatus Firestonebacteria bacterium]
MTQIEVAKKGKYTKEMIEVAKLEGVSKEYIRKNIEEGTIVIPSNLKRKTGKICGIGKGLRTKINVNLGTSPVKVNKKLELEKLKIAIKYGTDTVMDLSTGGDLDDIRRAIIKNSDIPVGTVPIYQSAIEIVKRKKPMVNITKEDIFDTIEKHIKDGVDFITVHCGVTLETVDRLRKEGRIANVVSRGGSFIIEWMIYNAKENPLYENFDLLLEMVKKYDVTLSLGDGLRPGSIADASDRAQIQELIILGELAQKALKNNIQVMIEGPGHVPIDQIEANVLLQKRLCHSAPFYVLGPIVTDIAPGYDHITSAIGASIAGKAGADFLCYVTPSEHLGLPNIKDVKEGTMASKIAAHVADIGKGIKGAIELDKNMSKCRKLLDWKNQQKYAIDPYIIKKYRNKRYKDTCTMCGEYCAMKKVNKYFK